MIFPIVISNSPFLAEVTVINNSGRDVPITMAVIVIIFSLIPSLCAMIVAFSTIKSLLKTISTIDKARIILAIIILLYFGSCVFLLFYNDF